MRTNNKHNKNRIAARIAALAAMGAVSAGSGWAQASSSPPPLLDSFTLAVITAAVILFLALTVAAVGTTVLLISLLKARGLEVDLSLPQISAPKIWDRFVGLRPSGSRERIDSPLEHKYDGIFELDNAAPPIFNVIFYGTIGFAVIYLLVYHVFSLRPLMVEEYENEIAQAELLKGAKEEVETLNEFTAKLADADLAAGQSIYQANCASCHGAKGEGKVGPNLTDEYWIHGGSYQDVFKTIKYGVPSKGMIPWKSQLNAKQLQDVAGFVKSLTGTNPPGGKAPEGEKYVESAVADSAAAKI